MRSFFPAILALLFSYGTSSSQISGTSYSVDVKFKGEISNLTKNAKVNLAFNIIDELEPQSHKDLIYLTEIPAPPFQETRRGEAFKNLLEKAGADEVVIDSVGNVIAKRKGSSGDRTIILDAHLDTVFPEGTDVKVKTSGDTLFAPGIGDDTRGLVVLLAVLKALNQAAIQTQENVWIVATVGEEGLGDLRGVKHLFREGTTKIDSWISIDGGEIGRLTTRALGSLRYRVTIKGPGGHSWGAFGMANPHHALGLAIAKFENEAWELTATGPRTSFNVGRIGGGTSVNSIPYESWMEVDMRSEDPQRLEKISKVFFRTMKEAVNEMNTQRRIGGPLELVIDTIGLRPSGGISSSDPLIQRTLACVMNFSAIPNLGTGSTNANIPLSLGVPAVTIGMGGKGGSAHSLDEWWINDQGSDAIKMALLLLVSEAGMVD